MGYVLAYAAARRGARVILVSGPTALDAPAGVDRVPVRSTEEMRAAVLKKLDAATVVIMAAAVADYRLAAPHANKIKRGAGRLVLELEPTPDILAELSRVRGKRILVGFAAETDHVAEHARQKLVTKAADLIVANDVTAEGAGIRPRDQVVTLYTRDGDEVALPRMSKFDVAQCVLDKVLELRSLVLRMTKKPASSAAAVEPRYPPADHRWDRQPRPPFRKNLNQQLEAWLRYFEDLGMQSFYRDRA